MNYLAALLRGSSLGAIILNIARVHITFCNSKTPTVSSSAFPLYFRNFNASVLNGFVPGLGCFFVVAIYFVASGFFFGSSV
jgi:hypothetical protein